MNANPSLRAPNPERASGFCGMILLPVIFSTQLELSSLLFLLQKLEKKGRRCHRISLNDAYNMMAPKERLTRRC